MNAIVVYGATGHTGRFVVEELLRQHLPVAVSGRNRTALIEQWGDLDVRPAAVDDPHALDRALKNAAAVINCAGPFATTAEPLIEAAARQRIPYVDVAAEIEANAATFARRSDLPVVPAMAFYGGLGDLLATALHAEQTAVQQEWKFPEPLGRRQVIAEFSMADIITIPSHLDVPEVRTYMALDAAGDLADADTPAPPRDSDQTFVVDVQAGDLRATAAGRDIYAISAPLAVGAVRRILAGETRSSGVASAGAMFDAVEFLKDLPLTLDLP